jgi:small multidrug resistance family-3 protein
MMRVFLLYFGTAPAEIVGCYSVYLWLRLERTAWWLIPGILALALFAWLLMLHPIASGRIYAAYGGVYIAASILWLWLADGVQPTR